MLNTRPRPLNTRPRPRAGLVELLFERAAGAAELAPLVERLTARAKVRARAPARPARPRAGGQSRARRDRFWNSCWLCLSRAAGAQAATAAAGGAVGVAELRARFQHVRLLDCQASPWSHCPLEPLPFGATPSRPRPRRARAGGGADAGAGRGRGQGEFAAALEAARALHARAGDNPALARDEMAPPRRAPLCPRPAHRRGVAAGGPARFWRCRGNGSKI